MLRLAQQVHPAPLSPRAESLIRITPDDPHPGVNNFPKLTP
jgi:hypothetical protein